MHKHVTPASCTLSPRYLEHCHVIIVPRALRFLSQPRSLRSERGRIACGEGSWSGLRGHGLG
eukprot:2365991-Rhodomonas_salina.1